MKGCLRRHSDIYEKFNTATIDGDVATGFILTCEGEEIMSLLHTSRSRVQGGTWGYFKIFLKLISVAISLNIEIAISRF